MAAPSSIFSIKPSSSSSSTISSMKLKTLVQTFAFSHMYRIIARALTKAKSLIIQLLDKHNYYKQKKKKNKLFFGSFRLHYNWCSETYSDSRVYHDSGNWSSVIPTSPSFDFSAMQEYPDELPKYLKWLEEKGTDEECSSDVEIDKLADLFIANCHEKFMLEKQESYRTFQEMMARSV